MRRLVVVAMFASVSARADDAVNIAGSLPPPPRQTAGSVPLSEPIAPVPPGVSSWAFAVTTLVGVADPFYDKVVLLGSVRRGYGQWAFEAFGGRAFSWSGPALDVCTSPTACGSPGGQKLNATPGALGDIGGVAGVWRAAEGKLSVGGLAPARFALEASLGAAAVSYHFVEGHDQTDWSPAARAGLGVVADLRHGVAIRLDVQGLFYRSSIAGVTEIDREMLIGASVAWQPGRSP